MVLNDKRITRSPEVRRGAKIYSVLSSRNRECSNARHLGDDFQTEFIPHMLESVQIYYQHWCNAPIEDEMDPRLPLSIVYEIMRGWKMPLLYEYIGKPGNDVVTAEHTKNK